MTKIIVPLPVILHIFIKCMGSHAILGGVIVYLNSFDWGVTFTLGGHFHLGRNDWGVICAYDKGSTSVHAVS